MAIDINGLNPSSNGGKPKNLDNSRSLHNTSNGQVAHTASTTDGQTTPMSEESEQLNIALSGVGKLMHKLEEKISQQPDVDEKRVAHFQALINSNQYKIDSKELANNIIASDNLL